MPVQPDPVGQIDDDFPVLARLARRVKSLSTDLNLPVGIREGAVLFGMDRGWQHHICVPGGFGQKDILHHQMLQACEAFTGMVLVRVGHRRVFAHDIHCLHVPCGGGIHDLDNC